MYKLTSDTQQYQQPVAVTHQGKAVFFTKKVRVADTDTDEYYYNVLNPQIQSSLDSDDWGGYQRLPFPTTDSLAGFNILRASTDSPAFNPYFSLVSDQKYIYLFRSAGNRLYACRYLLAETTSSAGDDTSYQLEPTWEVRYRRSQKPDSPADDSDTQSFVDMEEQPFYEPQYILPLGGTTDEFEISDGSFAVELIPTGREGDYRWQIFVVNNRNQSLYTYSLGRNDDGWFSFSDNTYNMTSKVIQPDHILSLTTDDESEVISFIGPPATTVYNKQEAGTAATDAAPLRLRSAYRLKLVAAAQDKTNRRYLASLDFAIGTDGSLAFLSPQNKQIQQQYKAGKIAPKKYCLYFDRTYVIISSSADGKIELGNTFVQQVWVYPQDTGLQSQYLLGSLSAKGGAQQAPSLWIENSTKIGFGFGDGLTFIKAATQEGVLQLNNWVNIIAVFDGSRYSIYVNGKPVTTTDDGTVFKGKVPYKSALDSIGAGGDAESRGYFKGYMDEIRVWNSASAFPDALEYIFKEIPKEKAAEMQNLLAYWRFDEGNGTITANLSAQGSKLDGHVVGAIWKSNHSPVQGGDHEALYIDDATLLTLKVGLIDPSAQLPVFANFGNVKPGTRPTLADSADGLLHLYYEGPDSQFYVAQYDTAESRAIYSTNWTAADPDPKLTEKGQLYFSARQSGPQLNHAQIRIRAAENPYLCTVILNNNAGREEIWNGVPRRISSLLDILRGKAFADPGAKKDAHHPVFYDYSGTCHLAYQAYGNKEEHGQLLFISQPASKNILEKVENKVKDTLAETTFTFKDVTTGPPLVATIKNLPIDAEAYVETLHGLSPDYDYDSPDNLSKKNLFVHILYTNDGYLLFVGADKDIKSFRATYQSTTQAPGCRIGISYEKGKKTHSFEWVEVPNKTHALCQHLQQADKGGNILANIAVIPVNTRFAPSRDYHESEDAGIRGILKLFSIYAEGGSGNIDDFTLNTSKLQGTTVNDKQEILANGAQLFYPISDGKSQNGYPELLTIGAQEVDVPLTFAGEEGGWIADSARKTVSINGDSGLYVPLHSETKAPLDIRGDLTTECWLKPSCTEAMAGNTKYPPEYPRLIHANVAPENDGGQYMMGLIPSYSLQFLIGTKVAVSDEKIDVDSHKLFSKGGHTIHFYIKVNLGTVTEDKKNYILRTKQSAGDNGTSLIVDTLGTLTYSINMDGQEKVLTSNVRLADEAWTAIAIVTHDGLTTLYVNAEKDASVAAEFSSSSSTLVLGANDADVDLEMEFNQVTVWNRPFADEEVRQRYKSIVVEDAEGLVLLWGLDQYRDDNLVQNSAIFTSTAYDTQVEHDYFWDFPGIFFQAYGACRDLAMATRYSCIAENNWAHLSSVYYMDYGIKTGGTARSFANCGNDRTLDVPNEFSIEAWFVQEETTLGKKQVLVGKYGQAAEDQSYEFGLDTDNHPYISLRVSGLDGVEEKERHFKFISSTAVEPSNPYFVGVSVGIKEFEVELDVENPLTREKEKKIEVRYKIVAQFVVNEQVEIPTESNELSEPISITASSAPLCLGRTQLNGNDADAAYFNGIISNVSLWQRQLGANELSTHFQTRQKFKEESGLISVWYFREQEGRIASDGQSTNNAVLSASDAWTIFPYSATLKLYVNGKEMSCESITPYRLGGYANEQLRLGNAKSLTNELMHQYHGQLDEVRIWGAVRTHEQLNDNMYTSLSGFEDQLKAYWQFEEGSGESVVDKTGRGSSAIFDGATGKPKWEDSDAPIGNEAPQVCNALAGPTNSYQRKIKNGPAMIEYADTQYDYYGRLFSVLKRGYIFNDPNGGLSQITGFKIGDLQQTYIGQVQSDPTIIGYIEGAPPIPSENLTRPYYENPVAAAYFAYNNSSSVKLSKDKNLQISYSASREDGNQFAFGAKLGAKFEKKVAKNIGVPPAQIVISTVKAAGDIGGAYNHAHGTAENLQQQLKVKLSQSQTHHMYNCGNWETPVDGKYYLKSGERMFTPNNEGVAFVKSATADVYALFLRKTGTLVGLTSVPNPDIPVDINYIYFPIEPTYTRNGTLDGRLGLQEDFICKRINNRGSYFRPIEAYSLKNRIERERQKALAYYNQFDAISKGKNQQNDLSKVIERNKLYDADKDFQKDIVNTYIWTAAGGLYSENNSYATLLQESFTGKYNQKNEGGPFGKLFVATPFGGVSAEANAVFGSSWTVNVHKSKEEDAQIKLNISADPDGFLHKYLGRDENPAYKSEPEPGKVDTYRFMSYYLAADERNINDLFNTVIDKEWLAHSNDPNARALRQARALPNTGAWRIMHRVTFVSRVMPSFQLFPDESQTPNIAEPVNQSGNQLVIAIVKELLDKNPPSADFIGQAIRKILLDDLKTTIPWWDSFLQAASVYNSEENVVLANLMKDTINYMKLYYETVDQG